MKNPERDSFQKTYFNWSQILQLESKKYSEVNH